MRIPSVEEVLRCFIEIELKSEYIKLSEFRLREYNITYI